MQIARVLTELEKTWKEVLPALARGLLPGLSEAEFEAQRQNLPTNFPEMLKTLYLWHNGQSPDQVSFLYHHFLSLEEALFEYRNYREVSEQIKKTTGFETWPEKFWPLWSFEGELFLLDLVSGQIYFYFLEDTPRLWYDHLPQMLSCLVRAVHEGVFTLNAQGELETDLVQWQKLRLEIVSEAVDSGPLYFEE